ncbi:TadE/TadG family type IV pilus assembly protein [Sphingomonas sp.]|uniref:TadE/TadG family type IV pilus assembly protein n=1 Tax=Sphingomonas sp. TaxID=28214 RepID=UPI003B3B0837
MTRLANDTKGAAAIEFALVAPVFLIFLLLLLEGGRAMFTQQAVNELTAAAARCAAIKATGCADQTAVRNWTVARGRQRSQLALAAANVVVTMTGSCRGQPSAIVTVNAPYKRGATALLPHSVIPPALTATACFPRTA